MSDRSPRVRAHAQVEFPPPRQGGAGRERRLAVRAIFWILGALCASALGTVRADGEVGLVIEEDGQVRTFCVAYSGASISGDDLLAAAGIAYDDLGTSSGSVLCSIEDTGCFDAGSYEQCWCKCSGSGGSNCVYWAFFTRDYNANWVYSSRAFDRTSSNDGDLHAWRWGQGGASSAPKPSDALTFESVCGHAPRGGVAPVTATSTLVATPTTLGTQPPPNAGSATSSQVTELPATSVTRVSSLTPEVSVTFTGTSPQPTPIAPRTADRRSDDEDGGLGALLAFVGVALVLVGGIGAAAYWRRSHGS